MQTQIAMIGFGEAAQAFAAGLRAAASVRGYDRKTDHDATRAIKIADFTHHGVTGCNTPGEALSGAAAALSLVTADQALLAAQAAAPLLAPGALWFDMNSVAPDTKRAAARAIEAGGGRYIDVAVMAPVHPQQNAVPLLLSGPHAAEGEAMLRAIGFGNVRVVPGALGAASAIKMIRSVIVKGLEALTAECLLAADAAGVRAEVLASLDASEKPRPWAERGDYNLDRMMVHGLRRAAEMEESVKTLEALGTGAAMTRGTVERQRAIGELGLAPPAGLDAKLAALSTALFGQAQERAA